jgi:hypothetical protein
MLLNDKIKKNKKKHYYNKKKHVYKCGYNDYPHLLEFC